MVVSQARFIFGIVFDSFGDRLACVRGLDDIHRDPDRGDERVKEWILVSVKHHNRYPKSEHMTEIIKWMKEYALVGMSAWIWEWDPPKWKGRGKNKVFHKGDWIFTEVQNSYG